MAAKERRTLAATHNNCTRKIIIPVAILVLAGLMLTPTVAATNFSTATGTWVRTGFAITSSRTVDGNTILVGTEDFTYSGDFVGTSLGFFRIVTGQGTFTETEFFTGTIAGASGTAMLLDVGQCVANSCAGQFKIQSGTGGLANVRGEGTFQGTSDSGTFAMTIAFVPAPASSPLPAIAMTTLWPVPFDIRPSVPHDFVVAPDGTVFFTVPGLGTARLNPRTNELTTWPIQGFHMAIGPAISIDLDGRTMREDFTLALARPSGSVLLLLPNSGVRLRWDIGAEPNDVNIFDITASSTHLWFMISTPATGTRPGDSTELASLDPVTNVLTRYNLADSIAGPGSEGFIQGVSWGNGRLWYGVTADTSPAVPFTQKTGFLDPATATSKVWPLFASSPGGGNSGIGRAVTFAAGSSWTFYHSTDSSLTGAYRLDPTTSSVSFAGAPIGTPGPASLQFPVPPEGLPPNEKVDRATMAAGAAWAVSSSMTAAGEETAHVVRWQPSASDRLISVSPESPTVTVSTTVLTRDVAAGIVSTTVTIPHQILAVSGDRVSATTTVYNFAGMRHLFHFNISPDGKVYLGLVIPSNSQVFVAQLAV